jgi:hypothetical protein
MSEAQGSFSFSKQADETPEWASYIGKETAQHTAPFQSAPSLLPFRAEGVDQRDLHDDLSGLRGSGFFLDELPDKSIDPWLLLHQAFVLCSRANEKGLIRQVAVEHLPCFSQGRMSRMPDLTLKEYRDLKPKDISRRLQEEICKMALTPEQARIKSRKSPLTCALSSLVRPFRKKLPPSILP